MKGGEGGKNWESNTDIYPPPCIKWLASKKLLSSTGSSAWCSVMPEGLRQVVGGRLQREGMYVCL